MSLLLNLINYSSSFQNDFIVSNSKQDDRSKSVYFNKNPSQNLQKNKTTSRSLSKIFPEKDAVPIDPKTRILHRITHLLSIKCKKHYYALLVTLETLKKKNLYLTSQGQLESIDKIINVQKIQKTQEQSKNQTENLITKQQKINVFVQKVEQVSRLFLLKSFEKSLKHQFFIFLKNNLFYRQKLEKLASSSQKMNIKIKLLQVFKELKKLNQLAFKIEILITLVKTIKKKLHKSQINDQKKVKQEFFQKLKSYFNQKNIIKLQSLNLSSNSLKLEQIPHIVSDSKEKQNEQILQKSIQFSISVPLCFIKERIKQCQMTKFMKPHCSILKSYPITTSTTQSPFIKEYGHCQKVSVFCKKIPQNYLVKNFSDNQTVFSEVSKDLLIDSHSNQNLRQLKQSRVTPYSSVRNIRTNPKLIGLDLQTSEDKVQNLDLSQISSISYLKSESTNTLLNQNRLNFSVFGGQAVNFKNSLVHERESLKNSQRKFIKKPQKYDYTPPLLAKYNKKNSPKKASEYKNLQNYLNDPKYNSQRNFNQSFPNKLLNSQRMMSNKLGINKDTQNFLIKQKINRKDDKLIYEGWTGFEGVSLSTLSYQTVFPTRDNSLQKGSFSKQGNGCQNYTSISNFRGQSYHQKPARQKGYIKLLNKK